MFQQLGYKTNEFFGWMLRNFYSRVVIPEHFLLILVIFSLLVFMSERITITAATLIIGLFTLFWFSSTSRFNPEKDKKPLVFTSRMKRLVMTNSAIVILFVFIILDLSFTGRLRNTPIVIRETGGSLLSAEPYFLLFGLILVDISIPFFLYIAAFIMKPFEKRVHERYKRMAREKLAAMPDLKIIGITGSYGKTSTKFLINSLLKERFSVCVTPGSYNTPMGICKVINNDLNARHQILILEMGARYEGNIKELCEIAKPDIAVITNVGKAHLETFGSQEAIVQEKSTLVQEVKPGGALILNSDDENVKSMARLHSDAKVIFTGIQSGSVRASDISYGPSGTQFIISWLENGKSVEEKIEIKLLGLHNVRNFLLAAGVAGLFDIRPGTIAMAARQVEPIEHRLELKRKGGLVVIDDAFNSNPVGAKNAVEILSSFDSGRRIIITPGMIELGELQDEENRKFGQHIANARLDLVILVGEKQSRPILQGIREVNHDPRNVKVVNSLFEANEIAKEYARDGDIILYENDLPDTYTE